MRSISVGGCSALLNSGFLASPSSAMIWLARSGDISARTCVLIASLSRRAATASEDVDAESPVAPSRSGGTTWICASEV